MNKKLDKILAEISAGELIDKITILEIKKDKTYGLTVHAMKSTNRNHIAPHTKKHCVTKRHHATKS